MIALSIVGLLCGCETTRAHQTFVFASEELGQTFRRYYESAPPESRAKLDALKRDSRVRIHVIHGKLDPVRSRGAASAPHGRSSEVNGACLMHPAAEDDVIEPEFDWDLVLDDQVRRQVGDRTGFPSPMGALLEHELLGHFMRCYSDRACRAPSTNRAAWRAAEEDRANAQENKYRAYNHLPLIDWSLSPKSEPMKSATPRAP